MSNRKSLNICVYTFVPHLRPLSKVLHRLNQRFSNDSLKKEEILSVITDEKNLPV